MNIGLMYSKVKEQKRVRLKKYNFENAKFALIADLVTALNEKIAGITRKSLPQEWRKVLSGNRGLRIN